MISLLQQIINIYFKINCAIRIISKELYTYLLIIVVSPTDFPGLNESISI